MSKPLHGLIRQLSQQFIDAEKIDATVVSVDASLMRAHGNIWHSKDLKAGVLPSCGGIDTEARWGMSGCKGWIFGYKMHTVICASPAGLPLPLDVAVTPGDTKDFTVFKAKFVPELFEQTAVILGDRGYAEVGCFAACDEKEISLLTPITVKPGTSKGRRDQAELLRDPEIQGLYARRRTTVEPYQGQLKSLFGLENLPMKGLTNVQTLCTLSTLAYCLLVAVNLALDRPALHLKATLLALR